MYMIQTNECALARNIREVTNDGVDIIRAVAEWYRDATNKRDAAAAARLLRAYGFYSDTVDCVSDAAIKQVMLSLIHPSLK